MEQRQIILVDEPSPDLVAAAKLAAKIPPSGPPPEIQPPFVLFPPEIERQESLTGSGYPAGLKLRSQRDGRIYRVDESGAFRRLTPKPLSKKERRKGAHV